jgi:hypothetical protein
LEGLRSDALCQTKKSMLLGIDVESYGDPLGTPIADL